MLSTIIENFKNPQFWTKTNNGYSFLFQSDNLSTYDQLQWFFKKHNIGFVVRFGNKSVEIDDHAYDLIQKAFKYVARPQLLYGAEIYDTLSSDDWQYIENHMSVLYDPLPKHPTRRDELIAQIDTKNLLVTLREQYAGSIMKNRLLREFIEICRTREENGKPANWTIDMSQKALSRLEQENADALHIRNGQTLVYSKRPEQVADDLLIRNLFHELRHAIQEEYSLSTYSPRKKTSGVYLAIRELASEVEAKVYELLLEKDTIPYVSKMLKSHTDNIVSLLLHDKETFSSNAGSDELMMASTFRYLQIRSEEETLQTLCNVFLAKNRMAAFQVLSTDNIRLSPDEFNSLMDYVENWKSEYIPRIMENIPHDKKDISVQFFEMEDLQKYWEKAGGVHMNLEPWHVFSKEVATNTGLYQAIYGEIDMSNCFGNARHSSVSYQVDNGMVSSARYAFQNHNYNALQNMYDNIQLRNPYLPKFPHEERCSQMKAEGFLRAIEWMNKHQPFEEILSALGYSMQDKFSGKKQSNTSVGRVGPSPRGL